MELLTDILIIVLLISVIALIGYLFLVLKSISKNIENMEKDVHQLSKKSIPLLEELRETIEKFNGIADSTQNKINEINEVFHSVKSVVYKFIPQKNSFQKEGTSKNPVANLIKNLQAISKGVSAFWNSYKTNK